MPAGYFKRYKPIAICKKLGDHKYVNHLILKGFVMVFAKTSIRVILFYSLVGLYLLGCGISSQNTTQFNSDLPVSTDLLFATTKFMTDINPPRNHKNLKSLDKAANFIEGKFAKYGYKPLEQSYKLNQLEYKNIIASFGPEEAPRFIVGAHYDVYGNQPGADDNASGVAGLLELARLFKVNNPSLNFRIDFVAFTLEEPPYFRTEKMGSYIHARRLYNNNVKVIGMVSLEMIGFFTDEPNSQRYPSILMKPFYPSTGNFIAVVGDFNSSDLISHFKNNLNLTSLNAQSLKAPSMVPGVDFSDHMNYWKFKYKALMITDTSFYRNQNYHKKTDTIDTLNFEKMAEVVKGVYWALISLNN